MGNSSGPKPLQRYFLFHLSKFKVELENLNQTLDRNTLSKSPFVSSDVSVSSKVWHRLAPMLWAGTDLYSKSCFLNNINNALITNFKRKQICIMLKKYIYEKTPCEHLQVSVPPVSAT